LEKIPQQANKEIVTQATFHTRMICAGSF
jgi:hypothetical protein